MMFTRPVPMHEVDVLGIGLIQRGVIHGQLAPLQANMLTCLHPQWRWVRLQAMEQAGQRIMDRTAWGVRLHLCRLSAGNDAWRCDQNIDIVQVRNFRLVHTNTLLHNPSTA